jgi:ubiquinone biosynthesis protein
MVSIVSAARDLGRIREVSTVLVRHGFGEIALRLGLGGRKEAKGKDDADALPHSPSQVDSGTVARRIRAVLEDLGPSFVKLGQLASTRPDLLPKEVIFELKKLQDSVGQVSFAEIREQMASTLRAPLEELFESISESPPAASPKFTVPSSRARTARLMSSSKFSVLASRPRLPAIWTSCIRLPPSWSARYQKPRSTRPQG